MRPESAALVRASWAVLAPQADAVAADFYARLRALDPMAACALADVDMRAQRRTLLATLDGLARVLDDPAVLARETADVARRHAAYGVTADACAGTAMLAALGAALGGAWTPAVCRAWRALLAQLAGPAERVAAD